MQALGIDLGGTKIEAALLDEGGAVRWRQRAATPAGDYAGTVRVVAELVRAARVAAAGELSIGVGTPGSATGAGLMKNCNSTYLNGRPLQADLEAAAQPQQRALRGLPPRGAAGPAEARSMTPRARSGLTSSVA